WQKRGYVVSQQQAKSLNEEELKRLTKEELVWLARNEALPHRSKMNKAQLARTLRRHYQRKTKRVGDRRWRNAAFAEGGLPFCRAQALAAATASHTSPIQSGPSFASVTSPSPGGPGAMVKSLRGQYLIAGRHLKDPNFFRSVVLVVEHNEAGSM